MSSIDWAVAPSSSINKTRMSVPFLPLAAQLFARPLKRLVETPWDKLIRNANQGWLTKHDSRMQVSLRQNSPNRLKMLEGSDFFDTALLMLRFKCLPQPTLQIQPSVDVGQGPGAVPADGDAMINDAGKHWVKAIRDLLGDAGR